jgi:hypothetical protein
MLIPRYFIKIAFEWRKFNLWLVFGRGILFNFCFNVKEERLSQLNF